MSAAWRLVSASTLAIDVDLSADVDILCCMFVSIRRVWSATTGTTAEKAAACR